MKKNELIIPRIISDDIAKEHDFVMNSSLYDPLKLYKNQITHYYQNKSWDVIKRYTNIYELVNKTPKPVSRSYFKLYEMMVDHVEKMFHRVPCSAVFLAEGPGGFVEAFVDFSVANNVDISNTLIHCNTLVSSHKHVPGWKIPTMHMPQWFSPRFVYGSDGSGNISSLAIADSMIAEILSHGKPVDFMTADGGFDFSADFNQQESTSLPLIIAEVYVALSVQCIGGSFIIKFFDICNQETLSLLTLLRSCYRDLVLTKPHTSRQANSERYIICMYFQGTKHNDLKTLSRCIAEGSAISLTSCVPLDLLRQVFLFNQEFISKQIANISKTIAFININCPHTMRDDCIQQQKKKATLWYNKYLTPVNTSMQALGR